MNTKQKPTFFQQQSEVVYTVEGSTISISKSEVDFLRDVAETSSSQKARVLLHGSPEKALHEMLIVHSYGHYIQPHINAHSTKSFVVFEGEMVVVMYKDDGTISNHIQLGNYYCSSVFMLRLNEPVFHTVVPISKTVTFLETVSGPHIETDYAPFAPSPSNLPESEKYMAWLMAEIGVNR
jgi:cupin fold WbuC family metalloprotein